MVVEEPVRKVFLKRGGGGTWCLDQVVSIVFSPHWRGRFWPLPISRTWKGKRSPLKAGLTPLIYGWNTCRYPIPKNCRYVLAKGLDLEYSKGLGSPGELLGFSGFYEFALFSFWHIFTSKTRWWFQIFFYVHPYLGKIPILTSIFFRWIETTNQKN